MEARDRGGEIDRMTTAPAIERLPSGEWKVVTDKRDIVCEHVVSARLALRRVHQQKIGSPSIVYRIYKINDKQRTEIAQSKKVKYGVPIACIKKIALGLSKCFTF
jgi:hypothetical protein